MKTRRDTSRLLVFGALIIAAILLVSLGGAGFLRPVLSLVTAPLAPAGRALTSGVQSVVGRAQQRQDYAALEDKLEEYERIIADLQEEVVYLREIERDYDRLSGLVD